MGSVAERYTIPKTDLLHLFQSQQKYVDHFFQNLDLSQALAFAETLLKCQGAILFSGVGKSGFVARSIVQTLVTIGIKSAFLSPIDALHGDIGIVSSCDILVLLSKSGNTEELLKLVPCVKAKGVYLISVTSMTGNLLENVCDLNVCLPLERELCPFDLAPVTSPAIQLVFGDTLATALMEAMKLTEEEYIANNPAGKIGKTLMFKVGDVMKKQEASSCGQDDVIMAHLVEINREYGCPLLSVNKECGTGVLQSSTLTNQSAIQQTDLRKLFQFQQKYLDHFFQNLSISETLIFVETLLNTTGTIFFSGVGKSGYIAQKISQTLVSLGISSAFLSPLDALHGDVGILSSVDMLVILSKSGNIDELLKLVVFARRRGVFLIAVTSSKGNLLEKLCDMSLHLPIERELCPFDSAPVTSSTIQMLFGDTVAIALMEARKLTKDDYATNHPAGRIGKSLLFKVKDVMKKQEELPLCGRNDLIMDQLVELTRKGCGCLLVIDEIHHLIGTFTDGDLRRTLNASGEKIFKLTVGEMCNRNPRTIGPDAMAVEAMQKMESPPSPVQFLPVINQQNVVIGIVTLHGLVSVGL